MSNPATAPSPHRIFESIILADHIEFSREQIYRWAIYMSAHIDGVGRYGAIKPPASSDGWFPAVVDDKTVIVLKAQDFSTPEEAVAWARWSSRFQSPVTR